MDTSPPVLSIRLLVPPLRLMTGFMWQVVHHQHVEHFGKLEHFVSGVLKRLPDLVSPRQKATLIMGLRTKMLLELCRGDVPADLQTIRSQLSEIQARHLMNSKNSELENLQRRLLELVLSLLEDPFEKEYFFKRVYPVEYGPDFDKALQVLVGYFISRLEKFLPVPNFKQVSSLIDSSSLWDECEQHLNQLEHLHTLHQNNFSEPLGESDLPSIVEDRIMSSLSFQCAPDDDHSLTDLQRMPSLDLQIPTTQGPQDENQKLHSHDQSYRDIKMKSNVPRVRDAPKQTGSSINKKQGDEDSTGFDLDMESVKEEDNDGAPLEVTANLPGLTYGQEQGSSFHGGTKLQNVVPSVVPSLVQGAQYSEENRTMAPPKPEVNPTLLQQEIASGLSDVSSANNTNTAVKGVVAEVPCHNAVQQGQDTLRVNIKKLKDVCKQYKCVICGLRLASREKWHRHRKIHMADKPYKCAHCGREFKLLNSLTNHQRVRANHGDSSQPPCLQRRLLGNTNSESTPASASAKTDTGPCQFCGETFSETALRIHLKTHPEYRPYHCSQCGKDFTSKVGLQIHAQRQHTVEKPYLCSDCGKWYQNAHMLKRHMKLHAVGRKRCCPICGKQYTHQANLTIHIRSHTGEKPYVCSQCGKAFGSAGVLQVHMRIHTGERPYRCEVCDLRCVNSSQFRRHARVHSGEKPFTCVHCGKGFSVNSCLKKHLYTHTGMKPYKCPQCPKSYCTRNHLNRHSQTHGAVAQ